MSLTSTVVSVKGVRPGEGVSYGMRFRTDVPRRIAVVPAGYADGIDTRSGNRGVVLVRGRRVPIVGAICMDMMMVDVTDVEVEPGDEVVIVGQQGAERLDMREIAATIGAIPWELLCRIGSRIERVYTGGRAASAPIGENGPWPRSRLPRRSTPARTAAPNRRSGWGAVPSAARGTRWSRSGPRRRSRPAAPSRATPRLRSGRAGRPPPSATPTSAWPPSTRISTGLCELDRVLGGGVVPGIAGAARRRAGHRQVDAAAAGGGALRPRRRAGPLRLGRGERAADQGARRAPRRRRRSVVSVRRDVSRADPRRGGAAEAGPARDRLHPDRVLDQAAVGAGQRRPGARGGDAAPVRGQGPATCRRSSSATSPRTAPWPAPRCSSTSSTRCSTSRASGTTPTASCGR